MRCEVAVLVIGRGRGTAMTRSQGSPMSKDEG